MHSSPRPLFTVIGALLLLASIIWIDTVTGVEVSVFFLYVLPVAWTTWRLGLGWGLLFAVMSGVGARWSGYADGQRFSHHWIYFERGATGLIMLSLIATLFHLSKRRLDKETRKVRQLEGILHICAVCQRVEDENGKWGSMADYLRSHAAPEPKHLQCPDCARAKYLNEV
jgi:predicted Fe-S protein YdhL (DUF1289 family)